ncbi:hypothetical protein OGAPHI_005806 [Ogataea philodendri]|uniref:Uncharacterized protein n=1 Tax=Ogataea philodendri TaxID=1378263 RepID=A0A9P8T1W0_9ASCO|nr:uncharacterized protein OGAPHI_005806 [Ogataea philodendri]KAH3662554.1 hypothetical protein OGAPHI_005806 [Ogataea philodendri]
MNLLAKVTDGSNGVLVVLSLTNSIPRNNPAPLKSPTYLWEPIADSSFSARYSPILKEFSTRLCSLTFFCTASAIRQLKEWQWYVWAPGMVFEPEAMAFLTFGDTRTPAMVTNPDPSVLPIVWMSGY